MKTIRPLLLPLLGCVIGGIAMLGCLHLAEAHATALAAAGPPATSPPIDWTFWLAVAGAALGGLSAVLHIVAPRTQNTWDDRLRNDVDKLLAFMQDVQPQSIPAGAKAALSVVTPPQSSGAAGVLAVLLLGALTAPALTGCATTKAAASAGTVAFLECEDGHLDAQALADVRALATAELQHLFGAGPPDTTALKADLTPIKSDLARCAWAGAVAALGAAIKPEPGTAVSALVAAGPDPAQVRAAFALAARQLGWAPMRVAGAVY